jgi:unsaturated rhamnogalacturonyl hydrolase
MATETKTALDYAKMGADTLMRKFTVTELPPANRFHYHQGVFLSGVERAYFLSGEKKYYDYIKAWVDQFLTDDGIKSSGEVLQFDDMQPGILLFNLYRETHDERYKKALDSFVPLVERWPTNAGGGFWHKYDNPNQMWLDGLYMIGPFCAQYAATFGKPYFFERVSHQMDMMRRNMTDSRTGLLYHAWDDSKEIGWADKTTGLSPEFWGRAMGWYAVAIMDILDYLPDDHKALKDFQNAGRDIIGALVRFQDADTGLWYQVVNKGDDERNWLETSCSCLYAYAICKAVRKGYLPDFFRSYAEKAYNGVINSLKFEEDALIVDNICVGTGVGDYEFYLNRPTVQNDLHGMGAFLLFCTEYYNMKQGGTT